MTSGAWAVARLRGEAADLHDRDTSWSERSVTFCEVTRPALVLGSTQRSTDVDLHVAAASGVDIARRRSGGGAVLVEPGRLVWADLIVPAGDPLWEADVARAFWWLGEVWAAALQSLGAGEVSVHRGPLVSSRWSSMICFAGLGPGEVCVGGRKAVGMAQRRVREGGVFHCAVPLAFDPAGVPALLALDAAARAAAETDSGARAAALTGLTATEVESALLRHLPSP